MNRERHPFSPSILRGSLATNQTFDFETASSHEVKVRAVGSHGESIEKTFMVEVIDEFLPIVRTVEVSRVSLGTYLWGLSNNTELKQYQDIGYLSVVDEKGEPAAEQYVFEMITPSELFSVSAEGFLLVQKPLDLQQKNQWDLIIGYGLGSEQKSRKQSVSLPPVISTTL